MITKTLEWIAVTFLAIAFVRFLSVCMNRDDMFSWDRTEEAESAVMKALCG